MNEYLVARLGPRAVALALLGATLLVVLLMVATCDLPPEKD